MFLACLRGLIPEGNPRHPWRSSIRTELVLANLAAELDAQYMQAKAHMHASIIPVLADSPQAINSLVEGIENQMIEAARLREMEPAGGPGKASVKAVTVDGLFKLYEAMMKVGFIKKAK